MKFHANFDKNWQSKFVENRFTNFLKPRCDTIQSSYQTMFLIHLESRNYFVLSIKSNKWSSFIKKTFSGNRD